MTGYPVATYESKTYPWQVVCNFCGLLGGMSMTPNGVMKSLDQHLLVCRITKPTETLVTENFKTIVQQMWDEIDAVTDKLMVEPTADLKNYARGLAFCLSLQTRAFFPTPTDVSREAVFRYEIRVNHRPFEPTPSYHMINEHQPLREGVTAQEEAAYVAARFPNSPAVWVPTVGNDRIAPSARPRQSAPRQEFKTLTIEEQTTIKTMHGSGMQPEELAQIFGCPLAQVKELVGI